MVYYLMDLIRPADAGIPLLLPEMTIEQTRPCLEIARSNADIPRELMRQCTYGQLG